MASATAPKATATSTTNTKKTRKPNIPPGTAKVTLVLKDETIEAVRRYAEYNGIILFAFENQVQMILDEWCARALRPPVADSSSEGSFLHVEEGKEA